MRFVSLLTCCAVALVGCREPLLERAETPNSLVRCTDSSGLVPTSYDDLATYDVRRQLDRWTQDLRSVADDESVVEPSLRAASQWARDECYLPCEEFQMCGEVRDLGDGTASVYIRADGLYCALSDGRRFIAAEAHLLVGLDAPEVIDSLVYHSGCYSRDPNCRRASLATGQ